MAYGSQTGYLNTDGQTKKTTSYYGDRGDGTSDWYHYARIVDGGHTTIGTKSDTASSGGSASLIAIEKRIRDLLQNVYNSTALGMRQIPTQVKTTTTIAATALTGYVSFADVDVSAHKDVLVVLSVTAISGTATAYWLVKHSGGNYGTFTSTTMSATGVYALAVNKPIGTTGRLAIQPGTSITVGADIIRE